MKFNKQDFIARAIGWNVIYCAAKGEGAGLEFHSPRLWFSAPAQMPLLSAKLVVPVFQTLSRTRNEREWDDVCRWVRESNGGDYPQFWNPLVIASRFKSRVQARWTV